MSVKRKILLTMLATGLAGVVASAGTFSAFSSSTSNGGNSFAAGTVYISDNDAGAALYTLTNRKPGQGASSCIKVTYTGSLDADVKIYTTDVIGSLGPYLDLTITPGTQSSSTFPSCTGFTASGAAIFSGTLSGFASAHGSYAAGLASTPASATKWATNDAVVYKVDITLQDDNAANGGSAGPKSTGTHAFVFEARNQ